MGSSPRSTVPARVPTPRRIDSVNHTAKNLIRFAGVVAGLAAAAWAMRDRLLPSPEIHDEPPPRFRDAPPPTPAAADDREDLTAIKGVGPVMSGRLIDAGITSVTAVAEADQAALAEAIGVTEATAARWIASAKTLT